MCNEDGDQNQKTDIHKMLLCGYLSIVTFRLLAPCVGLCFVIVTFPHYTNLFTRKQHF